MADATETKIDAAKVEAAAEKAYAAAAAAAAAPKEETAAVTPVATKAVGANAPARKAAVKPVAKKAVRAKTTKTVIKKKAAAAKAPVKTSTKAAAKKAPAKLKDTFMAKTQNIAEDFTAKVKDAVADFQGRAKVAFEKSSEAASEYGEFAKGNVEAVVESGKILAAGLQDMGKAYVADSKSAFETMTADVKELAAVKSPADFFKLQGEILRRNFDAAVAAGSKNSEKVVKLANEAFAPIQDRVSLAIDKVKKAA